MCLLITYNASSISWKPPDKGRFYCVFYIVSIPSLLCRVDVVLLSGDLANCPMEKMSSITPQELAEHHGLLERVVNEFLPLARHVYFIPGNVSHPPSVPLFLSLVISLVPAA